LFSANLAPGPDYAEGVRRVLPQYDNQPTRDWLMIFLLDLGVELEDGDLSFNIEERGKLKRIAAHFQFLRARRIEVDRESFAFSAGDAIQLFFSYRYTPGLVTAALSDHGLQVRAQWITASGEEGVFLCCRG
jgi:uncharacterized SAM-dependent methyltransferase